MSVVGAADSSPSDAWKMLLVKYGCCGTLTFSFYESLLTLPEEQRLVWEMPKSSLTKWLYLFSKYFALAAQLANTIVTFIFHDQYPLSHQTCRTWFICRVAVAHTMLICIELILMVRVRRLYTNTAVTWVLRALLLAEIVLMIVTAFIMQRLVEFSDACLIVQTTRVVEAFGSWGIVTHALILGLTIFPTFPGRGWRKVPIIVQLARDGTVGFSVISALLVIIMLYREEVASIVFSSFISVMSCVGCRLIINLRDKTLCADDDSVFPISTSILMPEESVTDFWVKE